MKIAGYIILLFIFLFSIHCENILDPYEAPVIENLAADHYIVNPGDTVKVTVTATNPEKGGLSYDWTITSGLLIPPVDSSSIRWKVPAQGGDYRIKVKVSNEKKSKSSDLDITVRSYLTPYIEVISPEAGDYFTQYSTIAISALAQHANGIAAVYLYVNDPDEPQQSLSGHAAEQYDFQYILNNESGITELKVVAVANVTGLSAADSITVNVEGIVPGKK